MTRAERAAQLFVEGYNCAQAVAMAFSDLIGMDEKRTAKMISSFGGGMGRLREVCGERFRGMRNVLRTVYRAAAVGASCDTKKLE